LRYSCLDARLAKERDSEEARGSPKGPKSSETCFEESTKKSQRERLGSDPPPTERELEARTRFRQQPGESRLSGSRARAREKFRGGILR